IVLAVALGASRAAAQQPLPQPPQVPVPSATPPPLPPRVGIASEQSITLDEAVRLALENNPAIAVGRVDVERARLSTEAARGVLDAVIDWHTLFQHAVTPQSSILGGSTTGSLTQNTFTSAPRVTGFLSATGATYQAQLSLQRATSTSQFVSLNPQFPSSLT